MRWGRRIGWTGENPLLPGVTLPDAVTVTERLADARAEVLLVAANTTGGVTGKMISPQSIAIACAAVGLVGKESDLFRFTVKHSLIFTCMVGVITTLQAYVLTWMIP